jgi:hypothetical protein
MRLSLDAGAEEVGADRAGKLRIVDDDRDIGAGAFSGALPAGSDFGTVGILVRMNPVVGGVARVAPGRGNERQCDVDTKRHEPSGKPVAACVKFTDLDHLGGPFFSGSGAGRPRIGAASGASLAVPGSHKGVRIAVIERAETGPK